MSSRCSGSVVCTETCFSLVCVCEGSVNSVQFTMSFVNSIDTHRSVMSLSVECCVSVCVYDMF